MKNFRKFIHIFSPRGNCLHVNVVVNGEQMCGSFVLETVQKQTLVVCGYQSNSVNGAVVMYH